MNLLIMDFLAKRLTFNAKLHRIVVERSSISIVFM